MKRLLAPAKAGIEGWVVIKMIFYKTSKPINNPDFYFDGPASYFPK